jgi:uncharacterized protein (DUF1499 family)
MKILFTDAGFMIGVLSIIMILISGPFTRLGIYPFTAGLLVFFVGSLAGLAAIIAALIRLISGTQFPAITVTGLIFGALSFGLIVISFLGAIKAPVIHDITTDTIDPPGFISILPLRKNALNPVEYGGPDVAGKQISAFPDIKTIHSGLSRDKAFDKALKAAESLKWEIVDQNREKGRIEAFDTTFWFGFRDDIVIRIKAENGGSVTDIRSLSRVGMGDMGTNARRVRKFINLMSD